MDNLTTLPDLDKEIISKDYLAKIAMLSESEHSVFCLAGKGYKLSEIAKVRGGCSPKTVESQKNYIKEKLELRNCEQIVALASRYNLFRAHYPEVVREFVPNSYRFRNTVVLK